VDHPVRRSAGNAIGVQIDRQIEDDIDRAAIRGERQRYLFDDLEVLVAAQGRRAAAPAGAFFCQYPQQVLARLGIVEMRKDLIHHFPGRLMADIVDDPRAGHTVTETRRRIADVDHPHVLNEIPDIDRVEVPTPWKGIGRADP